MGKGHKHRQRLAASQWGPPQQLGAHLVQQKALVLMGVVALCQVLGLKSEQWELWWQEEGQQQGWWVCLVSCEHHLPQW